MITCKFENNTTAHLRHVTIDGLVIKDQQILLVKRSAKSLVEPEKYSLPGGYLECNETANQGIAREVLEETGYQAQVNSLFMIIHTPRLKGDDRQNVAFIYSLTPHTQIQSPDHEIQQIKWFDLNQLPPAPQIAFDHYDIIQTYIKNQANLYPLPYVNFKPVNPLSIV